MNKTSIIAGILGLFLIVVSEIPFYPPENLIIKMKLFSYRNIDFYSWGYVLSDSDAYSFVSFLGFEGIIYFSLWFVICCISISSLLIAGKKAHKFYTINIILAIMVLIVYGILIIFAYLPNPASLFVNVGLGYYILIIMLVLNIFSKRKLKNKTI